MIYTQVAIRNYVGNGVTLLSACDEKKGLVTFVKSGQWSGNRQPTKAGDAPVLISDSTDIDDRDFLFTEDYLQESVRNYFDMQSSGKLIINDDMRRFDVAGQIEVDSIKEKGRVFRFSPSIANTHIAALATVYYINMSKATDEALSLSEDLSSLLLSGGAISI